MVMVDQKQLPEDELTDAAKNWVAIDGLWFLVVEEEYGIDVAIKLDRRVWQQFSVIEGERIKRRLHLPERGGLDALEIALDNRLVHLVNEQEIRRPNASTLLFSMKSCRVQAARERRNLPPLSLQGSRPC